jgi:SAM-dependent methyltransferase
MAKKGNYRGRASFFCKAIVDFSEQAGEKNFTLAIANMSLMSVVRLPEAVRAVHRLLKKKGGFIFLIVHPCFWPVHQGLSHFDWFDYKKEVFIEAQFFKKIESSCNFLTTYIHRPLELYLNVLTESNFEIEKIVEPIPSAAIKKKYPEKWVFPRFLGVRCRKK